MFAAFLLERDYPKLADILPYLDTWAQTYGLVAFVILLLWIFIAYIRQLNGRQDALRYGLTGQLRNADPRHAWKLRMFWFFAILTAVAWLGLGATMAWAASLPVSAPPDVKPEVAQSLVYRLGNNSLVVNLYRIGCILALITLGWEMLVSFPQMSARRLWALARFSIKEAVRRRVLWGFLLLMLVFLFGSWFIPASRADTQWKTYVNLVFFIMAALTLLTAGIVACFSLPNDIRNLSIHTVVTKPVLKFEVVLGRILGLVLLMTLVLLAAGHLSLLFAYRGVDEQHRASALRARNQIVGQLDFEVLDQNGKWSRMVKGTNIGREYDLRQYIAGASNQEAVWRFVLTPAQLARLRLSDTITIEFNFDIFRTSKGTGRRYQEGVEVMMAFVNRPKWSDALYTVFREDRNPATGLPSSDVDRAKKFGYYEPRPLRITDEAAQQDRIQFPTALLEGVEDGLLEIRVSCRTYAQYLGLYKYDLYILDAESNFYLNYLKGLFGIWCWMVVVVCLGTIFSTYLNAPVSLMLTGMLLICGMPVVRAFIFQLTDSTNFEANPAGGPFESFYRLVNNTKISVTLEQNRGTRFIQASDFTLEKLFAALYRILPDLGVYDRSMFVAEGFNVPAGELGAALVLLLIYLVPYLIIGYYLINLREIATW